MLRYQNEIIRNILITVSQQLWDVLDVFNQDFNVITISL